MSPLIKKFCFLTVCVLVIASSGFWACSSSSSELPQDPKAAEAVKLVQTHPARQATTIQQAILDIVKDMKARGKGVYMGDWRVAAQGPDTYVVSVLIREKGFAEWIERDYAWRVNLKLKALSVITLPATYLMPFHELPPLPHDSDLSSLPSVTPKELRLG